MDVVDRRLLLAGAGLAGVAALSKLAKAGDLTPPQGPITPTGTRLSDLDTKIGTAVANLSAKLSAADTKIAFSAQGVAEPRTPIRSLPASPDAQFVITQPGAYCLTDNIEQSPGMVCIDIQCDDVDIDCQGFGFVGAGAGSPPSSCVRAVGRRALEIYDCSFSGWQGCCIDCDDCDDVSVSDCLFHVCRCPSDPATGLSGAVIRCRDRCEIDDVCVSECDGCTIQTRHACTINDVCCADSSGSSIRCGDGCCVRDASTQNANIGAVLNGNVVVGSRCLVQEVDVRNCPGLAIDAGASCVIECCEVTGSSSAGGGGGGSGGIRCADGSCVSDCSVLSVDGLAIECSSRCCVEDCKALDCWGINLGAECTCCDNEVSWSGGGGGGGIFVVGERCCVSGNFVSNGGIVVDSTGHRCLIEDNLVVGAGGPPGTGGGMIAIAQGATGCHVRDNHVRRDSITNAFIIPTGNSFGPVVNAIGAGDISALPGSSHPQANFIFG